MAEPVKNILLVGRIGNGKSATGNTLIGRKMFESKKQAVGVTMECKMYRAAIKDGPIINVIDTPGLSDSAVFEDLSKEITKCLTMAVEGIHAVLFVLSAKSCISPEEEATLNALQRIFGSKILDYCIFVFTGGDELEEEGQTLDDFFCAGCPEFFMVLFNNKNADESKKAYQLKQLVAHIADVEKQTGGVPYTCQMHLKIKEENDEKLRERERVIESKNRAEAEAAKRDEKLRRDKEILAQTKAAAKLMEQQRATESKKRTDAELVVKHEKLRMEREKLQMEEKKAKQLAAQAEAKRLQEKQMNERKKKWIVYARDLSIAWSENISYWSWVPLRYETTSSESVVEAAVLKNVCWLAVNGKFDTRKLTPETKYEVVYVVKLEDSASGWGIPVNLKLTLPDSRATPQERKVSLKDHIGKQWVYITAGEFMTSSENAGEISFSLYETASNSWKRGLYVKGVEIRSKN